MATHTQSPHLREQGGAPSDKVFAKRLSQFRSTGRAVCLLMATLLLVACPSPRPEGFNRFDTSVEQFQTGADEVLDQVYQLAKAGFTASSPWDNQVKFSDLVLTWEEEGDPTQPTVGAQPLHTQIRDLKRGVQSLNEGLRSYTSLLLQLATAPPDDAERISGLAKEANKNLRAANDTLKLGVDNDTIGLVSTLGAEVLRQKIQHDRWQYLRESMDEAQPKIDSLSNLMATTFDLLAGDLKRSYLEWTEIKRREHSAASEDGKRKILEELLDRNDTTVTILDTIRTLRQGYKSLPSAHSELRKSLDQTLSLLVAVQKLHDDALRLQRLYDELRRSEEST